MIARRITYLGVRELTDEKGKKRLGAGGRCRRRAAPTQAPRIVKILIIPPRSGEDAVDVGLFICNSVAAGPATRPANVRRVVVQVPLIVDPYTIARSLVGGNLHWPDKVAPIFVQYDNICQACVALCREHG